MLAGHFQSALFITIYFFVLVILALVVCSSLRIFSPDSIIAILADVLGKLVEERSAELLV